MNDSHADKELAAAKVRAMRRLSTLGRLYAWAELVGVPIWRFLATRIAAPSKHPKKGVRRK